VLRARSNANAHFGRFWSVSWRSPAESHDHHGPRVGGYNHVAAKWQWVRNHIELFDLIEAGTADVKNLNYVGAEQKYSVAMAWTKGLRDFVQGKDADWQYDPAADFAKKQKNADVSNIEKLTEFEHSISLTFGHHYDSGTITSDLLSGNTEISDRWWGNDTLGCVHR